jgi:hypothetical protein
MKKKLSVLVFLLGLLSYAQAPVGNGNNQLQRGPFEPFYDYSYTQSIYYASEINAAGTITGLQWYFSGDSGSTLTNSQNITIYLGHTTQDSFISVPPTFVPISGLTAVYTGGVSVNGPGWVSIVFNTPFVYNGTDNLVIAVDENTVGHDAGADDFYNSPVATPRTVYFYGDGLNPDPANPPTSASSTTYLGTSSFIPNVILNGLTPLCAKPESLSVSNITPNGVDLSWTTSSGSQDFEYAIQPIGLGAPTGSGTVVTGSTSVSNSTLLPNTEYDAFVRTNCGTNGYSAWYGPVSFVTICETNIAPWTYDVETAAITTNSTIEDCWSSIPFGIAYSYRWNVHGIGPTTSSNTGPYGAYSGDNYFYTEASNGSSGAVAELYTPLVNITAMTAPSLQFYYHMYGGNMGSLHIDVYDGTAWVNDVEVITGQQHSTKNSPWTLKVVSLASYTGVVQVRFRGIRGAGSTSDMAIDSVSFVEMPTCFPPTNIVLSNITTNGVSASWDDMTSMSQYDFEYVIQPQNSGLPTTSGELVDGQTTLLENTLNANTAYELYIRAYCGTSYSVWVGPYLFNTLCNSFTVPYVENFDLAVVGSTTNTTVPSCWSYLETQGGSGYAHVQQSAGAQSTPLHYFMNNANDLTGSYMLVSPMTTNLTNGLNRVSFYGGSPQTGFTIEVGTLSDPTDPTTFSLITSIPLTTSYVQYFVDLPVGTNSYLAFKHGLGGTYRSIFIDSIELEVNPNLSVATFDQYNFKVYPNPTKDILNVEYSSIISTVKVINVLGQTVMNTEINSTSSQLDISELNSGTYMVVVSIEGVNKVVKIVKQ